MKAVQYEKPTAECTNLVCCQYCGRPIYVNDKRFHYYKIHHREFTCDECRKAIATNASMKAREKIQSLSPEEQQAFYDRRVQAWKEGWNAKSDEEKYAMKEKLRQGLIDYYRKSTDEDHATRSERTRNMWASMPPDKYDTTVRKIRDAWYERPQEINDQNLQKAWGGVRKYWDSLTREEYEAWKLKWALYYNENPPPSAEKYTVAERQFAELIESQGFGYQHLYYNTTKHPDFDRLFPVNPCTGSTLVVPYHQWDFLVIAPGGEFLVDIDGSVHDPRRRSIALLTDSVGRKINVNDLFAFKDAQRPYQTDGKTAFIVQAYNNNIEPGTTVLEVTTGNEWSIRQMLALMSLEQND